MNELNLSKSKYCRCKICPKMYWMDTYKVEEKISKADQNVLVNGQKVGEFAKGLFGKYEDVEYNKDLNIMIDATNELLKNKPNIITEASFKYDNNFCSVDILKNDEDGVEIYEVKSSKGEKAIYLDDIAYQYYIVSSLGFNVKRACLVHISKEYVKHGPIDIHKFFTVEDETEIIKGKQEEVRAIIDQQNVFMKEHGADNEPESNYARECWKPYRCDYLEYCTKELPKPSVFDLKGMGLEKRAELYHKGKVRLEDLVDEKLTDNYREVVDFVVNNRPPKINKEAIKQFLDLLKYPLYFVDYETCQEVFPEIDGVTPYQQLPFQYSLHIIKSKGAHVEHKEFLADPNDKDYVRHFTENLIKDIPGDGSVIIYNRSFEPARNKELAVLYPEYKKDLERINSNIVDFMIPFANRDYYMKEMLGSYSIKIVLPALFPDNPEYDYKNLEGVHNGLEAPATFLSMRGMSIEEQAEIRKNLLDYCALDTLALVKILEKFEEIVGE